MLLTVVQSPTSFEALRAVNNVVYGTFREACLEMGLLEDDGEWATCLQEATLIQTGFQLRSLFIRLLIGNTPTMLELLWMRFREHLCDDLGHRLQVDRNIQEPTNEDINDFGLFLMEGILHTEYNKSLREFPAMPLPTLDWNVGPPPNPFITEQRLWNRDTLEGTLQRCIPLLNQEQLASYTVIL